MRYHVAVRERTFEVEIGAEGVTVDGTRAAADLAHVSGTDVHSLLLDGASYRLVATRADGGGWDLYLRGRRLAAEPVDERTRAIREMTGSGSGPAGPRPVRAPMPGLVVKVEVAEGDTVEVGRGLVIVEAMKMENELRAEAAGVVARVHVETGQAVEKDQVLVDFRAPEGTGKEEA
ncbi:MAG: acetyl-CoA carboxylase biotin carboxyl carrier protein subunit [Gemmatimonadetes bacterium]|nr:acetyl-CoA carboxylase biotin carboxyl carrier protein subunit [Gemmatimonadota bacterium]